MGSKKQRTKHEDKYLGKYRDYAVKEFTKSQESFDKVLLTLSSGALGISISLTNNIIPISTSQNKPLLFFAWIFWVVSLIVLLVSHLLSASAWNKTIDQIDSDKLPLKNEKPGEPYNLLVSVCNYGGLSFFVIGLILFISYILINLEWC